MIYKKVFVEVKVIFDTHGRMMPLEIKWEDTIYEIDKILDVRASASLKVGGAGQRFTCRILGKQTYLFFDENRWFVEAKG